MTDLKCCPFCGGEAKICNGSNVIVGNQFLIRCKEINCTIRPKTDWHTSLEEAIKHWNTRKPMDNIVEKLKENSFDMSLENPDCKAIWTDKAINIVKKEINNGLE